MPETKVTIVSQQPKEPPKEEDRKNLILWIVFAVAVLILLGLGIYWYLYQRPGAVDQAADHQTDERTDEDAEDHDSGLDTNGDDEVGVEDNSFTLNAYNFNVENRMMKAFNGDEEDSSLSLSELRTEDFEMSWSSGLEEYEGNVYFTWEPIPIGFTGEETEEEIAEAETSAVNMVEDYYVYGGVWCYDTVAKEFKHLITASDEYWGDELPYEVIDITRVNDTQYLFVSFAVYENGSDQELVYARYLIDGSTNLVYETSLRD